MPSLDSMVGKSHSLLLQPSCHLPAVRWEVIEKIEAANQQTPPPIEVICTPWPPKQLAMGTHHLKLGSPWYHSNKGTAILSILVALSSWVFMYLVQYVHKQNLPPINFQPVY